MAGASGKVKPVLEGEDLKRIADVRRDVWTGGLKGLVTGLFVGSAGFLSIRKFGLRYVPKKYTEDSKYYVLTTLLLGSCGSFVGSLVAGKNSIIFVSDIFQRGAKPQEITPYQENSAAHQRSQDNNTVLSPVVREKSISILSSNPLVDSSSAANGYHQAVQTNERAIEGYSPKHLHSPTSSLDTHHIPDHHNFGSLDSNPTTFGGEEELLMVEGKFSSRSTSKTSDKR